MEELLHRGTRELGGDVVEVRFDLGNRVGFGIVGIAIIPQDRPQHIRPGRGVARADPVARAPDPHFAHRAEPRRKLCEDRRAGRCDEFDVLGNLPERDAGEDLKGRRSRQGKAPVRAVNPSGPFDERRRLDAERSERMDPGAGGNDIADRIRSAHLVEPDIIDGNRVDLCLRHGDAVEDSLSAGLDLRIKGRSIQEIANLAVCPAMRVLRLAVMNVRIGSVLMGGMRVDVKFRARDVLSLGALEVEVDFLFEAEGGYRPAKNRLIHAEVAQGTDGHIAADSRKTIEVKNLHGKLSGENYCCAHMLARHFLFRNLAALLLGLGMVHLVSAKTFEEINDAFGIPVWSDENLWDDEASATAARLRWPEESRTSMDSSYRAYPGPSSLVLGARPRSLALYGENGRVSHLSLIFANKGDGVSVEKEAVNSMAVQNLQKQEKAIKEAIKKDAATLCEKLTALLGPPAASRFGQGSQVRENVQRWDWKDHAILLSAPRGEYVALRILPVEMADAQGRSRISDNELKERVLARVERRANGDVVLQDMPMVNQGPKGYCVPATWERVMRYMAVPADMYVLAMAGSTAMGGGTDVNAIANGARTAIVSGGRRFEAVNGKVSVRTAQQYINHGLPLMWTMYSTDALNAALKDRREARASTADPVAWRKSLDPVRKSAKKIAIDHSRAHMCMIIGYNDKTGELAVSDSWGPAFAERWITEEEAVAVSQAQPLTLITY